MESKLSIHKVISGTLLIAGTAIGAGMLGIPLLTARAGFWPAVVITLLVWIFMACTGLLYLEASLWMPDGGNILSMSKRFLGTWGRHVSGGIYLFLYYCLMVAYFAAGAPIFSFFLESVVGLAPAGLGSYFSYGLLFGGIVALGLKIVDRVNYILMIAMFAAYGALIASGAPTVETSRFVFSDWSKMLLATPILFSAFGYHNVIPSLTSYFHRNVRLLRLSIWLGTAIACATYLVWQWLIIGAVSGEALQEAFREGRPATAALESMTGVPWVVQTGRFFAFFAIVTSMLGVAFSMVDFMGDGLKVSRTGFSRVALTILIFLPPFLLAAWDPAIFVTAISFAGGFGEAFLNGLLPVLLVWVGRYAHRLSGTHQLGGEKYALVALLLGSLFVMGIEGVILLGK